MRGDIKKEAEILDNYRRALAESKLECPPKVQRAAQCIHKYLHNQQLTVNWMKTQCHINGKSFSARFKVCLGRYPKEYIIHHRIESSKQLLKQTRTTITQVALLVGFNSHSAFCKAFKNKEGIRPSKWK